MLRENTFWAGRRCLVTGGFGFGGSHLSEQLLNLGARVYVVDRARPRNSYMVLMGLDDRVNFIQGDVRDTALLKMAIERNEINLVFHLAAEPTIPVNNAFPLESLSINVMGTYSVLEAARTSTCARHMVFASSGAYYGTTTQREPISEDQPAGLAANVYTPSKIAADVAVRCFARTYGLKTAVCRFINTYGPGNTNFSTIVPRAISHLLTGQPYDFGARDDGTTCLDFLHIRDMTQGYLAVAENLDKVAGEAFNFGGDACVSVRDLVRMISRAYDGQEREPLFHGPKREVSLYKYLDTKKAQRVLAWQPTVSLDAGLKETVEWYRRFWSKL